MKNLWRTGIIYAAINFLALAVHWVFQFIVSPQLGGAQGEYGLVLAVISFIGLLSLPPTIATQAVTHYIARFHFGGDDARLHGLLAGCRKFLFHVSIAGSIIAIVLVKPLSEFFSIPRSSLTIIALICVLGNLWTAYATALCQGLGWFKRLALIGLLSAIIRVLFGWPTTKIWPLAEWAVLASAVMLLPNLILFFWRKEFPKRTDRAISPWTTEFVQFLVVSTACAAGIYFFSQGDLLIAKKYFPAATMDAYGSAGVLARALPTLVGPLLAVLFTHRSIGHNRGDALTEQLKLVGLYTLVLVSGGVCLFVLRNFALHLLHRDTPEAAAMIGPFAVTMVFVGLLQAIGTWALASRWTKISLLYGMLSIGYWLALLFFGKTSDDMLRVMPIAAGIAFAVLFAVWLIAMRLHKIGAPEPD